MTNHPERALILIRLSNLTDESSSPARQRDICERFCALRGWQVVGVAEDLDVSAKHGPFDRASLAPWLAKPQDYDVIVFWKVDRLVRRVTHLAQMVDWSDQHGVKLVSATEPQFDLSTPTGQAMAYMVGIFGQMEREATVERTEQAFKWNMREGKYRGGHRPFGYMTVKTPDGWRFKVDPAGKLEYLEIVERVLSGERPATITRDLNDRGVLTHQDRVHVANGKPPKGSKWRSGNLVRILQSPSALGQSVSRPVVGKDAKGGKVYGEQELVRGDDGLPVQRAESLISVEKWNRLQGALAAMNGTRSPYKKSGSLLLRVIYCGVCGMQMYRTKGRNCFYYRCAAASFETSCGNKTVRQTVADETVTEMLLGIFGELERRESVFIPGADNSDKLTEVEAQLADLVGIVGTGLFRPGKPEYDQMITRIENLQTERDTLATSAIKRARYEDRLTGQSFGQYWESLDSNDRNLFLRNNGVTLKYITSGVPEFDIEFGDLPALLGAIDSGIDKDAVVEHMKADPQSVEDTIGEPVTVPGAG